MQRRFLTWIEFPIQRKLTNMDIINSLQKYPLNLVNSFVLSDKAAGLEKYCNLEEILQRNLTYEISEFIRQKHHQPTQQTPTKTPTIWNVIRTGDRCDRQLQLCIDESCKQGTNGFIFVSGHDFRDKLLKENQDGIKCDRICSQGIQPILCGMESKNILNENKLNCQDRKRGAVFSMKKQPTTVDYFITQASLVPPVFLPSFPEKKTNLILTVIPCLSLEDVENLKLLDATVTGVEELQKEYEQHKDRREFGMKRAKEFIQIGSQFDSVVGFYLYSKDIPAVIELAQFISTLK